MRSEIKEYQAVEEAAMKFVKSVAEGNSKYAKELFTDEAVLFGFLNGEWKCVAKAYNQNSNTIQEK